MNKPKLKDFVPGAYERYLKRRIREEQAKFRRLTRRLNQENAKCKSPR